MRIELKVGNWSLAEIKESGKGDIYCIYNIPNVGLHLSFHRSGRCHVKAERPYFCKEIRKPTHIYKSYEDFLSDYNKQGLLYQKENRKVLLIEPTISSSAIQNAIACTQNTIIIDILVFANFEIKTYIIDASEVEQKVNLNDPPKGIFDPVERKIACVYPWAIGPPIVLMEWNDSNLTIGNFLKTKIYKGFIHPICEAFDHIYEKRPREFEQWSAQFCEFMETLLTSPNFSQLLDLEDLLKSIQNTNASERDKRSSD